MLSKPWMERKLLFCHTNLQIFRRICGVRARVELSTGRRRGGGSRGGGGRNGYDDYRGSRRSEGGGRGR